MTLKIKTDKTCCFPGSNLNAAVLWEFDPIPSKISIELVWQTSGKGTDDSETVFKEEWSPESKSGEKQFVIEVPRGPISVLGNLISIEWTLRVSCKKPKEEFSLPIIISHLGDRQIELYQHDALASE